MGVGRNFFQKVPSHKVQNRQPPLGEGQDERRQAMRPAIRGARPL